MHASTRRAAALGSALAAVGATLTVLAPSAQAVGLDQNDRVRYRMCADTVVDIEYTNAYGNTSTQRNIYFKRQKNGARCGFYDYTVRDEYGSYASVWVTAENGGSVSCTIWRNGRVVAKSNDENSFYSSAACY
ncbi:hypothetical protein [Gordonia sp. VNK21]|uniref:hypothetical protein n=1 Tax=Gordonia sp. VNK21 TaxID=3382483 RepID=UPI0038D36664